MLPPRQTRVGTETAVPAKSIASVLMFPLLAVTFLAVICCVVTASFLLDLSRADAD
jgi:hypothetical protein